MVDVGELFDCFSTGLDVEKGNVEDLRQRMMRQFKKPDRKEVVDPAAL